MKGYIKIDKKLCKECHLCIYICPNDHITSTQEYNSQGYHPVCVNMDKECNGCALCATMCPEIAIEVYRD